MLNVSEGTDLDALARLNRAAGVSLVDRHADSWHNRSVFTLINTEAALLRDLRAVSDVALRTLDLTRHRGVHPRFGILDVVPFVPLEGATLAGARRLREAYGAWLATNWDVPVFFYGPDGGGDATLPEVRRGAFVSLAPTLGPAQPSATRGAAAVGAREVLLAWNIWLEDVSLEATQRLAASVRSATVRALGLATGAFTQVSCNLTSPLVSTPSMVLDAVRAQLSTGRVARCELVGLTPAGVLKKESPSRWRELDLAPERTIEFAISELSRPGPDAQ